MPSGASSKKKINGARAAPYADGFETLHTTLIFFEVFFIHISFMC